MSAVDISKNSKCKEGDDEFIMCRHTVSVSNPDYKLTENSSLTTWLLR